MTEFHAENPPIEARMRKPGGGIAQTAAFLLDTQPFVDCLLTSLCPWMVIVGQSRLFAKVSLGQSTEFVGDHRQQFGRGFGIPADRLSQNPGDIIGRRHPSVTTKILCIR